MITKKNIYKFIFILVIVFQIILFQTGCGLLPNHNAGFDSVNNNRAIIVAVDGLSFANTILGTGIENSNDYLQSNISKLINSNYIRSFTWGGNAENSASILASSGSGLRKFLIDNYNEAKADNKAFIVVSHSWGTFLSYLALSLEPQIECDLFITLSSPLGTNSGLPSTTPEKIVRDYTDAKLSQLSFNILGISYPHTKLFYNFMANGDLISGSLLGKIPILTNVHDVQVDQGISDQRDATSCYFWHKFTSMGDEIVTLSDPSYSAYLAYLTSIGIYDISPTRNDFLNQVVGLIQSASGY